MANSQGFLLFIKKYVIIKVRDYFTAAKPTGKGKECGRSLKGSVYQAYIPLEAAIAAQKFSTPALNI